MNSRLLSAVIWLVLPIGLTAAQDKTTADRAPDTKPLPDKTSPPDKSGPASTGGAQGETRAAIPPDLVRLKNGGMVRGTIGELVPNDRVTVTTAAGETRTFSMSDVAYAGPAAESPVVSRADGSAVSPDLQPQNERGRDTRPAAPPASGPPTSRLRLSANYPHITFYVNTGQVRGDFTGYVNGYWTRPGELMFGEINTSYYSRLCTSPCEAIVPEGRYTLALGIDDEIVPAEKKFDLKGTLDVQGEFVDKSSWRTAGMFVFGGSLVAGLVLMLVDRGAGGAIWLTGAGVALAGGITGGIMLGQRDRAYIEAKPSVN
jgi:hypothetical protein